MLDAVRPGALRLRARMWWGDPAGHYRDRLLGPTDWELAAMSDAAQKDYFAQIYPVSKVLENARYLWFTGFDDDEAFRVVAESDETRRFLERQLLQGGMQGGLRDISSWLLSYTLFERRGFAEIRFDREDEQTVFKGLRVHNPRTIERSGDGY